MALITLRQARRLEKEIEQQLIELSNGLVSRNVQISIYEGFEDAVRNIQETTLSTLDNVASLMNIRFDIRRAIEIDNEASGLNKYMNEEARRKEQLRVLKNLCTPEFTPKEKSIAEARHMSAKLAGGVQNSQQDQSSWPMRHSAAAASDAVLVHNVLVKETLDSIKLNIKTIERELRVLVDAMMALNTSRTISPSDETVKFLESLGLTV